MSLNWDVARIRNNEVVTTQKGKNGEGDKWHPITDALVWHSMGIDMGNITEENWKEFYLRVYMWEKVFGPSLSYIGKDGERIDRYITPLDVYTHIGFVTNVSTKKQTGFGKKILDTLMREKSKRFDEAVEQYEELGIETMDHEAFEKHIENTKQK